jgi:hypothetical protein
MKTWISKIRLTTNHKALLLGKLGSNKKTILQILDENSKLLCCEKYKTI